MLTERVTTPLEPDGIRPYDRSMLVLQYMTALIAALAAAILAELR